MTERAYRELPKLWRETLTDFWWADRFGWTPTQVDAQPAARLARLKAATEAVDEGRAKRAKENANATRR